MIARKAWYLTVAIFGLVPAVVLCLVYGFIPGVNDVKDPLGSPSKLSDEIVDSAHQFDVYTAGLVPKHKTLSENIQVLNPVSINLKELTDSAGKLSGQAKSLNASTADVTRIASPLPGLIQTVTERSDEAAPTVAGLSTAVGSVTTQLENINDGLVTAQGSLGALGPRAHGIAKTLATVQEEAAHVRELGPLLAILGPLVNGPKTPAPKVPTPGEVK